MWSRVDVPKWFLDLNEKDIQGCYLGMGALVGASVMSESTLSVLVGWLTRFLVMFALADVAYQLKNKGRRKAKED